MQVENISKGDIGIVTPYKRQEMEIHSRLVNLDLNSRRNKFRNGKSEGIEVGSVEKFQGNEKKIMIISTVKSRGSTNFLGDFVGNDKRFNVAITRAKYLVIIIGDERILNQVSDGSVNRIRVFGSGKQI